LSKKLPQNAKFGVEYRHFRKFKDQKYLSINISSVGNVQLFDVENLQLPAATF